MRWRIGKLKTVGGPVPIGGGMVINCSRGAPEIEELGHVDAINRGSAITAAIDKFPGKLTAENIILEPVPNVRGNNR